MSDIITFLQSFSLYVLPIFYVAILFLFGAALISKSDFFSNFKCIEQSKFFSNIGRKISITDFFLMVSVFIYFEFFVFAYNSATVNLAISHGVILISFLVAILSRNKAFKKYSSIQFFKTFFTIILFVLISNMFAYPEAFSIEKPGNIDILKITALAAFSMLSGFILATSVSHYFARRRDFKIKNKFQNRTFFNKIFVICIANAFVLLLFTEFELASKALFLFSFILGISICKKFTEENWQIINKASVFLITLLLCISAIFIGNMFLTIASSAILALAFKDLTTDSFTEFLSICKSSFLCKR